MRRIVLFFALAAVVAASCTAPPVRTTQPQRVLIVGDSFVHGSSFLGFPTLIGELRPLLHARGIDVRVVGGEASRPIHDNWIGLVEDQVDVWDPDLVILQSNNPESITGYDRGTLAVTWAWMAGLAAQHGADVWRIDPPNPQPGKYVTALWGHQLPDLRATQAEGVAAGAANRQRAIDIDGVLASCPAPWTFDGYHLVASGQRCLAAHLNSLI